MSLEEGIINWGSILASSVIGGIITDTAELNPLLVGDFSEIRPFTAQFGSFHRNIP